MSEEMPRLTKQRKNESENVSCSICLEVIRGDCFVCGRCVCACCCSCFLSWLNTSATCPMCRRRIEDDELARYPLSIKKSRMLRLDIGNEQITYTEEEEEEANAHFPFVESIYNEEKERLEEMDYTLITWNTHNFTFRILEEQEYDGDLIHTLYFGNEGVLYDVRYAVDMGNIDNVLSIKKLQSKTNYTLRRHITHAFLRWCNLF